MTLPQRIRITDVGPRDGLQNERGVVPTDAKVRFISALAACGVAEIEVTSFVSPKWVPQLADAEDVLARVTRLPDVIYSALVPNEQGLDRAMAAGVRKIAVFTAASETFSQRNSNAGIAQTLERFAPVVQKARAAEITVRAYISCVVQCPYEGPIAPSQVHDVAAKLLDLGVHEIDLGETLGVAGPADIERLYEALVDLLTPEQTTLHLHDTRGTALACAYRAMQLGVCSFDSSCAGLGGCPFAPGATGNLATEDLVYLGARCGIETGVNMDKLLDAGRIVATALGRPLPGRYFNAATACLPSDQAAARATAAANE